MRRAVPAMLLVLSSCVGSHVREPVDAPPYAFFPPVGFEEEDRARISVEIGKWNAVTNASHQLGWSDYGHLRILPLQPPYADFVGQWLEGLGVIFIRPEAPVAPVALHELGHAIGLEHVADANAVMCSGEMGVECVPFVPDLTPADVHECQRVGACP